MSTACRPPSRSCKDKLLVVPAPPLPELRQSVSHMGGPAQQIWTPNPIQHACSAARACAQNLFVPSSMDVGREEPCHQAAAEKIPPMASADSRPPATSSASQRAFLNILAVQRDHARASRTPRKSLGYPVKVGAGNMGPLVFAGPLVGPVHTSHSMAAGPASCTWQLQTPCSMQLGCPLAARPARLPGWRACRPTAGLFWDLPVNPPPSPSRLQGASATSSPCCFTRSHVDSSSSVLLCDQHPGIPTTPGGYARICGP
jgi:hypothetical protein